MGEIKRNNNDGTVHLKFNDETNEMRKPINEIRLRDNILQKTKLYSVP